MLAWPAEVGKAGGTGQAQDNALLEPWPDGAAGGDTDHRIEDSRRIAAWSGGLVAANRRQLTRVDPGGVGRQRQRGRHPAVPAANADRAVGARMAGSGVHRRPDAACRRGAPGTDPSISISRRQRACFLARVHLEGLNLLYKEGWPVAENLAVLAEFRNEGLSMRLSSGHIGNLKIQSGNARFADFKTGELQLHTLVSGDAADALGYLRATPIDAAADHVFSTVEARGADVGGRGSVPAVQGVRASSHAGDRASRRGVVEPHRRAADGDGIDRRCGCGRGTGVARRRARQGSRRDIPDDSAGRRGTDR